MNTPTDERRLSEVARHSAQEAIALQGSNSTWQNTILAVIGSVSLAGTVLFWVIDAKTDKKLEPLKTDIALMKRDYSYIKEMHLLIGLLS